MSFNKSQYRSVKPPILSDLGSIQSERIPIAKQIYTQHTKPKYNILINTLTVLVILGIGIIVVLLTSASLLRYSKNQKNNKEITLIILVVGDNLQQALRSIQSFISTKYADNYQIFLGLSIDKSKLLNSQIKYTKHFLSSKYPYQIEFIDQIISQVQTDYYFFTTSQWELQNQYFLQFSKQIMSQFPSISQVFVNQLEKLQRGRSLLSIIGFSFSPGLHRTQDYHKVGKFSTLTSDTKLMNFEAQKKISYSYYTHGYKAVVFHRFKLQKIQKQEFLKLEPVQYTTPEEDQQIYIQNYNIINKINDNNQVTNDNQINQNNNINKKTKPQRPPSPPKMQRIFQYANYIQSILKQPRKIYEVQLLKQQYLQLPFCILLFVLSDKHEKYQLLQSINSQGYGNIKILIPQQQNINEQNYYSFRTLITQKCIPNSVVMFVNCPLQPNSLKLLNKIHQQNLVWVTYAKTENGINLFTFYSRIYELLQNNDFNKTNKQYLEKNDIAVQTLGMLELCSDSSKMVEIEDVIDIEGDSYFYVNWDDQSLCNRITYTKIHRLSQDIEMDVWVFDSKKIITYNNQNQQQEQRAVIFNLNNSNMIRAAQRQQSPYLPNNHSIKTLQFLDFNKKYNISLYTQKQKQTPFCLTILNHNNIQNNRYIKAINSIVQQDYQNYHIVFIDDDSDDQSLQLTIQYFKKINFPKNRLTFIKNKQRKYATFNILNAAYYFCQEDQVQILMDGDDQLIGKYAFQVMNAAYQKNNNLWVVYSNFKNNYYQYGQSRQMKYQSTHMYAGKRKLISNIGPIRTWRVQAIYNIPIEHHKNKNGQWLDMLYDDALQHPLSELSTVKRLKYINEILYQYNTNYGDNDNSNDEKKRHRQSLYKHVITLTPLTPLETLNGTVKNVDVARQLQAYSNFEIFKFQI